MFKKFQIDLGDPRVFRETKHAAFEIASLGTQVGSVLAALGTVVIVSINMFTRPKK